MSGTFRCARCGAFNRVAEPPPGRAPICGRCKQKLDTSGLPQPVTTPEFQSAIATAPLMVLVDFWAAWCGPCRMAAPLLEQVGREHAGQLLVLKVNTDEHPELASSFQVTGLPTFVLLSNQREVGRQGGLPAAGAFKSWVNGLLRT